MQKTCPIIVMLFVMLAMNLHGQLDVSVQNRRPRHPGKDTWWCPPDSAGKVWHFDGSEWQTLLVGDGRPAFLHQGLVWIPYREHHDLATTAGKLLIADANMVANNGKVFVGLSQLQDLFAVTVSGDTLAYFKVIYRTRHGFTGDPLWYHQNLEGNFYEILPQYTPGSINYHPNELHCWGVVDSTGRWVVPPVFDEPFRFANGVAVVKHYGQRRVINLKGEFVE